jgi:hypothetical protein
MHDGFMGTSTAGMLFGVGGWVTGSFAGNVTMILDGDEANPVDFGDASTLTGPGHQFFGVIDPNGFSTFEIRELEGKTGDQKFIFADDFTFGTMAEPCNVDADCSDGAFCNGAETCNLTTNQCEPGTPVDCGDGVACTVDSCNEGTDSCDNVPSDGICDNGQFCDGAETCDPVNGCQPGTPVDCDDVIICTVDSCNETTDQCDNIPNDFNCPEDGLFCNGIEFCDAALDCQSPGDPCPGGTTCNEGTDTCDVIGCTSDAECDDGLFCNGGETCNLSTHQCEPGIPVDCNDGVGCTDDSCDEANDTCANNPNDVNCPDDGFFCNGTEFCDTVNDCSSAGDPCPLGTICNEETDTCEQKFIDLDIRNFQVTKKITLGRRNLRATKIRLFVQNSGTINAATRPSTVIGMQNGIEVYNKTMMVSDPVGDGPSKFTFPSYTPETIGDIIWTVTIADDDPDDDTASTVTQIVQ